MHRGLNNTPPGKSLLLFPVVTLLNLSMAQETKRRLSVSLCFQSQHILRNVHFPEAGPKEKALFRSSLSFQFPQQMQCLSFDRTAARNKCKHCVCPVVFKLSHQRNSTCPFNKRRYFSDALFSQISNTERKLVENNLSATLSRHEKVLLKGKTLR